MVTVTKHVQEVDSFDKNPTSKYMKGEMKNERYR